MNKETQVNSFGGMPMGPSGEDAIYAKVGAPFLYLFAGKPYPRPIVTAIVIREDLSGPMCMLKQVYVYSNDQLLMTAPVHHLEHITYPVKLEGCKYA